MKKASTPAKKTKKAAPKKAAPKKAAPKKTAAKAGGEDLQKIFEDQLKDIYWAEKHLTKALPKMSKAADAPELKEAFTNHLAETKEQVDRLVQVFDLMGKRAQAKKCAAMEGLVTEGSEAIEEYEAGPGRDVALIVSAQKVEHYEIAAYGSLIAMANVLQLTDVASLLEATLQQETNTDELLSTIAADVNQAAYEVE